MRPSDSPLPAGEGADPCLLCSLRRRMEVGILFLCAWRVDRVSLGHGGVDLVKESTSGRINSSPLLPLAGPAGSGMWAACFSRRSMDRAVARTPCSPVAVADQRVILLLGDLRIPRVLASFGWSTKRHRRLGLVSIILPIPFGVVPASSPSAVQGLGAGVHLWVDLWLVEKVLRHGRSLWCAGPSWPKLVDFPFAMVVFKRMLAPAMEWRRRRRACNSLRRD